MKIEKRDLDGLYFRVKRDGAYDNVCFSDLSGAEMDEVLANRSKEWLKSTCKYLGGTIRRIGDEFNGCGKDEDEEDE